MNNIPETAAPEQLDEPLAESVVDGSAVELIDEDLLVEDVSIDGMCGVY